MTKGKDFEVEHFVDNYPWDGVGDGTVVDVSIGHPIRQEYQVSFQKTAKLPLIDGRSRGLCLSCNCHQVPQTKIHRPRTSKHGHPRGHRRRTCGTQVAGIFLSP
jgi:hypothetical protein